MGAAPISDLKNKLVLVTGAARGIGQGVAFEYARLGAKVILLDILSDALQATTADARKLGYDVHPFVCDVSSNEAVATLGAKVIKEFGVPDILYNNAFHAPHGSIENLDIEAIRYGLDVSVLGYLRIVKAFLNDMIARKSGWIVNTSSPNGVTPAAKFAHFGLPYNLCKAADMSMSQAMAAGLKEHNIGVSIIWPGPVNTEAITEIALTAPADFATTTKAWFEEFGATPDEVGKVFVEGVRQGKFLVTTFPNFENILVEYAKNGLDPNADYAAVFGEIDPGEN